MDDDMPDECDLDRDDLMLLDLPASELHQNEMEIEAPSQPETSANGDSPIPSAAIVKIEQLFESLVDSLLHNEKHLCLTLPSRVASNRGAGTATRQIRFPGKTAHEAWRFTAHVRVLELMHEALVDGIVTTKRDIFYNDPALFVRQSVVDRIVDDISFALAIPRASLNVTAAAKGLVAGRLSIVRADDTILDASLDLDGSLIPMLKDDDTINMSCVRWIIVIEKEAVFRTLLSSSTWAVLGKRGIAVTGKGYPDIATRALLKRLATLSCHDGGQTIPIFALVDYDPDGIGILSTYKHGSMALQHEDDMLRVSSLQRLGLRSEDVLRSVGDTQKQNILFLSPRDRRKASKMLEWEVFREDKDDSEWRRELQIMLMLNFKAEIELLDAEAGGVGAWLSEKLLLV